MTTYTVTEKENLQSIRKGYDAIIDFGTDQEKLKFVKSMASKTQFFQDTVLTIEQDGALIAYKDQNGWQRP
jgi:hypothetical protein